MSRLAARAGVASGELPGGTVTFLLTDVVGSTRLWESAPAQMEHAMRRQLEILDRAISAHRGVRPVEQGEGDSTVAAFARAGDAVAAALEAQRALLIEEWPTEAPIKVRSALHSGDARFRDEGNYAGAALNRCARLRAIAQGGQILLSRATGDLVEDGLPEGAGLLDLGIHRLRGLGRPEQVFALAHPDLPPLATPPQSARTHPSNLPSEPSTFIGREQELTELGASLEETRLLTLTGTGGCGKTRLALRFAGTLLDRFPGGAWWVELAKVTDARLLEEAVAAAVGVQPLPAATAVEAVSTHLSSARALIVLDNCEHLIRPCAELVQQLLEQCPDLTVLATSREPLGLAGEVSRRVPSLSVPGGDLAEKPIAEFEAIRLFCERARQVEPGFELNGDNESAVVAICTGLDGIPLAIELAAARVRVLSCTEIASGLDDRFRLLSGGTRMALPRQRTLLASVEWSHDLLTDHERVLLRRLGVFSGGFSLRLAEEACADENIPRESILDLLASLVDRSLVVVEEARDGVRYRLLETIRQFALDRLEAAGETASTRDRHRGTLLRLAEEVAPDLVGERQPEAVATLETEAANLEAAVAWAAETEPETALRLCAALTLWWRFSGRLADGDAALARALEASDPEPAPMRARVLWGRAYVNLARDFERAERCASEALENAEELGETATQARALAVLATIQLFVDLRLANRVAERACEVAREAGDEFALADAVQLLGVARWSRDDYAAANEHFERALELARRIGHGENESWCLVFRGMSPFGGADLERRRADLELALAIAEQTGEPACDGFGNAWLAHIDIWRGEPERAITRVEASLRRMVTAGAAEAVGVLREALAIAAVAEGERERGQATLRELIHSRAAPAWTLSHARCALAAIERIGGDLDQAEELAGDALTTGEHVGSRLLAATACHEQGRIAAARGEWARADSLLHDALAVFFQDDHHVFVPDSLEGLAEVAAGMESAIEATRFLAAALRSREELGVGRWRGEDERWEALALELRERLGERAYEKASEEGRGLDTADAVAYASRARGERRRPSGGWESLTPTELEVARYVAEGLTNPEIGERMFIERSTVKTHLVHIYAKLGLRNRAELAAATSRRDSAEV